MISNRNRGQKITKFQTVRKTKKLMSWYRCNWLKGRS